MKQYPLVLVLAAIGATMPAPAAAQDEEVVAVPGGAEEEPSGLWLEVKLSIPLGSVGFYSASWPAPRFVLGYRWGGVMIGAQAGASFVDVSPDEPSTTTMSNLTGFDVSFLPLVQVEVARAGPLALHVQAGAGVVYRRTEYSDQDTLFESLGAQFSLAFGGRYFLGPRFALGTEIGVAPAYTWMVDTVGADEQDLSAWTVDFHAAVTVALLW